jgi:hypothetical protein
MLQSAQFKLQHSVDISNIVSVQWILDKRVKTSHLEFNSNLQGRSASEYLRFCGGSVCTVHFSGDAKLPDKVREMSLVAIYCRNVTVLRATKIAVTSAIKDILWCNPNIEEICFKNITCSETHIFDGLALHKLRTMNLDSLTCKLHFPWSTQAYSDSLQRVTCRYSNLTVDDFVAWFKNCPNLQAFSVSKTSIGDPTIERINACGPNMSDFSISNDTLITDAGVLCITTGFTSLRSLNIQNCAKLTSLSLQRIAEQCGDRLEILYVDVKDVQSLETENALKLLSEKCTKLKVLNINCGDGVLCLGEGTSFIVRGCASLHTLIVNKHTTICATSRNLINVMRPDLQILVHDDSTSYDVMTGSV